MTNNVFSFAGILSEKDLLSINLEMNDLHGCIIDVLKRLEVTFRNSKLVGKDDLNELETLYLSFSYSIITGLNSIFLLIKNGFAAESLNCLRTVLETLFFLRFLLKNKEKAVDVFNKLLKGKNQYGFGNLIKDYPDGEEKDIYKYLYSFLCKFSHPTQMTFYIYSECDTVSPREYITMVYFIYSELLKLSISMFTEFYKDVALYKNNELLDTINNKMGKLDLTRMESIFNVIDKEYEGMN